MDSIDKTKLFRLRRNFLKLFSTLIATFLPVHIRSEKVYRGDGSDLNRVAMLVDISKCIGCGICNIGCKLWNNLPLNGRMDFRFLSEKTWTVIIPHEDQGVFRKWQCMHCEKPPCLCVCPTNAIYKRPDGVVWIHGERCIGCKYCIPACPYRVRFYDEEIKYVVKCSFCFDRIDAGKKPMCVSVCPVKALEFGTREKIIETARQRAKEINGYMFGDEEEYGNDVIYVSPVPFEKLGRVNGFGGYLYPTPKRRVPATDALSKLLLEKGGLGLFGSLTLAFFSFIFWRRSVLKEAMKKEIPRE